MKFWAVRMIARYPVRAEHAFPPTQAVKSRQLSRSLFNRFQLSSDARPQGAVYSTGLASLGWVCSQRLGQAGQASRQGGGAGRAGRAGLSELLGTHPHKGFDLSGGVQHRMLPDTYQEGPFGTILFVLEGPCGIRASSLETVSRSPSFFFYKS